MTESQYTNDLDTLTQWVGRRRVLTETISAETCNQLAQTLDRSTSLANGDVLPPLWHFVTHLTSTQSSKLGSDGHPTRGEFLPPVALPRRMWAGSRIIFSGDILLGESVTKTSTIEKVESKTGRSGQLCFVTVRHELAVDANIRIAEEQDLVFREHPAPDAPRPTPPSPPGDAEFSRDVTPSEVLLFRYSALTFNAHRIHYDRDYARTIEGYDGLVVHGPLTATLLADLAVSETGERLASFSFRGLAPLLDTEPFAIAGTRTGNTVELWAQTRAGAMAMQASATLQS